MSVKWGFLICPDGKSASLNKLSKAMRDSPRRVFLNSTTQDRTPWDDLSRLVAALIPGSSLWKVPARGNDMRLSLYVELPKNCSDASQRRGIFADNTFVEQWSVKCAGGLTGGTIQIAGLKATMTDVLVRIERTDGTTQVTRLTRAASSFTVEAAPKPTQVGMGLAHSTLCYRRGGGVLVPPANFANVSKSLGTTMKALVSNKAESCEA